MAPPPVGMLPLPDAPAPRTAVGGIIALVVGIVLLIPGLWLFIGFATEPAPIAPYGPSGGGRFAAGILGLIGLVISAVGVVAVLIGVRQVLLRRARGGSPRW